MKETDHWSSFSWYNVWLAHAKIKYVMMGEMTGIENHCLIEFFLYSFFCTNLLQCISLRVSECTVQNVQSVTQSVWNICNAVNMQCEKGVSVVWIRDMYWWKDLVTLELVLLLPCLKCMRHPFVVLGLLVDAQEITDSHINLKDSSLFWNINNTNISKPNAVCFITKFRKFYTS